MATETNIVTLYQGIDSATQQAISPRTKTSAVSDENNVGLDALLDDINSALVEKSAVGHTHTASDVGMGTGINNTNTSGITTYPQAVGTYRVTSTLPTGMPTGAKGYGTLFIANGGTYYLHIYIDNTNAVWMTRTSETFTPSASSWNKMIGSNQLSLSGTTLTITY